MTEIISASVFVRYRSIAEKYRLAVATHNDVARRLEDARRRLPQLQAERERMLAPRVGFALGGRVTVAAPPDLAGIDGQISAAASEITLLTDELAHVEVRKDEAGSLLARCAGLLRDRGASREQLEY